MNKYAIKYSAVLLSIIFVSQIFAFQLRSSPPTNKNLHFSQQLKIVINLFHKKFLNNHTKITNIDNTWSLYENFKYGFSMKIPKKSLDFNYYCLRKYSEIPVNTIEDEFLTILPEFTYTDTDEINPCKKIYLDNNNAKERRIMHWNIHQEQINNKNELTNFVKNKYGDTYEIISMIPTEQDGVFDFTIGRDCSIYEYCRLTYAITHRYSPKNKKIIYWARGHGSAFIPLDNISTGSYDIEMIESFRFLP